MYIKLQLFPELTNWVGLIVFNHFRIPRQFKSGWQFGPLKHGTNGGMGTIEWLCTERISNPSILVKPQLVSHKFCHSITRFRDSSDGLIHSLIPSRRAKHRLCFISNRIPIFSIPFDNKICSAVNIETFGGENPQPSSHVKRQGGRLSETHIEIWLNNISAAYPQICE